jgi:hypothetical protein
VSWFRKAKGTSPTEIDRSLAYLRGRGFDVDGFLEDVDVDRVLAAPLGKTADCLSPTEIASLVERDQLDAARRLHVGECDECRRLIGIYERASHEDWTADDELHIVRGEQIWIPEGGDFYLIMANRGKKGFLRTLDPESVEVKGSVSGKDCVIETLDPSPYEAREAVKLLFNSYDVHLPKLRNKSLPCVLQIEGRTGSRELNHRELVFVRQLPPPAVPPDHDTDDGD